MLPFITWPAGKSFAFTIFDDTDLTTLRNGPPVYDFLIARGLRITKSVWLFNPQIRPRTGGSSCEDQDYLAWVRTLQAAGHEIAFHNASDESSKRDRTIAALNQFRELFGHYPRTAANHSGNRESIYAGERRLTGLNRILYRIMTRSRWSGVFEGEDETSPYFWGDVCRQRIRYYRSFSFRAANTLSVCPFMPYYDPARPFVYAWFVSSDGPTADTFAETISPRALDRLEAAGGACIMYAHLGAGFFGKRGIHPGFARAIDDVVRRSSWCVPVAELLDFLADNNGVPSITRSQRSKLERRWLADKLVTRKTR